MFPINLKNTLTDCSGMPSSFLSLQRKGVNNWVIWHWLISRLIRVMINSYGEIQYLGLTDLMTPNVELEILCLVWLIKSTSMVPCVKKFIPAQLWRCYTSSLPCAPAYCKWRQVIWLLQETQVLTWYRLTLQGSLGEVGCGPDLCMIRPM